ncbi:MAG: hypothetical protein EBR82_24435 [Caulobacteraceae bacterium]|jgi:hypothetical protein|nr:hypothetical protein [Caulobacteraceae bacterium]
MTKGALDIHKTWYEILVNYTKPYDRYQVARRLSMEVLYLEASDIATPEERKKEIQKMIIILSELE